MCICLNGFFGLQCEHAGEPCKTAQCLNGGACSTDMLGKMKCHCTDLWHGEFCQTFLSLTCKVNPCYHGGTCQFNLIANSYACSCPNLAQDVRLGFNCETLSVCHFNPCLFNGTCVSLSTNEYRCLCMDDYTGQNCEVNLKTTMSLFLPNITLVPGEASSSSR